MENIEQIIFQKLPKNKRILLIKKVSLFKLIIFMPLKLMFDKIIFLEMDKILRKKKLLSLIEGMGFLWMNYNDYDIGYIFINKEKKSSEFCDKYGKYFSKKIWNNSLSYFFINKDLLATCINSKIRENIIVDIYELFEIAKLLKKNNSVYLISSNNFFFKCINKSYKIKNLNIFNFEFFINLKFTILIFLNIIVIVSKKIFLFDFCRNLIKKKNNKINKTKKNFNVAFFPHKGMFVQNKVKDQFYLKKKKSKFNKKNIAHIEWTRADLDNQSIRYYNKNNLSLYFWDTLSFKKKSILKIFCFFLFKFKLIFLLYKFSILREILSSAYQVQNSKEKFKYYFPRLKYVLAGYDLLFTTEISIACKILKIETVCAQDRILVPSWSPSMCFDHYLALGPSSKKILEKRMGKSIKNFHKFQVSNGNLKSLNNKQNKNKLRCLVIDFNSLDEKNWYSNGRSFVNWKTNFSFYKLILELSIKHKNISFYIKSKNYIWLKNRSYKKLIINLQKQRNIFILKNQKKWTPIISIKYTDFAIAKYSSLSDQMFFLNKPIIIYDYDKFPSKFYNFDNRIMVKTEHELNYKINKLKKNYYNYNISLEKIRKNLFYYRVSKNSVKELLIYFDKKLTKG